MRKFMMASLAGTLCVALALSLAVAQRPDDKGDKGTSKSKNKDSGSTLVDRMMAFDKNKDGKLTKEELTDKRLHRLFDMADTKKNGFVTRDELVALAEKLEKEGGGPRGKGGDGPRGKGKGKGGPGGGEDDGPGGPGGPGGPPRPGLLLHPRLMEELDLTAEQEKQLTALQKHIDEKLAKILTAKQKKQLEARPRGPGGRGPGGPPPEKD